jgi:CCR4-NOT transcriptional regulation complex NOT5 subunit
MKKYVSISNNDIADKKTGKTSSQNSLLKPGYFSKFSNETLFYIFYYMPRDTLQLYASEELYKRKWRYHTEYAVWFFTEQAPNSEEKIELFFNQIEWKVSKFIYGDINQNAFLSENEVYKHSKTSSER